MVKITKANGDVWEMDINEAKALMGNETKVEVEYPIVKYPTKLNVEYPIKKRRRVNGRKNGWTKEEDNILKSNHSKKVMKKYLPHRTLSAITTRIKILRTKGAVISVKRMRMKHNHKKINRKTDGRIKMLQTVSQIFIQLRKIYPHVDISRLRKLAFEQYNKTKTGA